MLKLFIKKRCEYAAPEGQRLYAIGDVHGCFAQMVTLLEYIRVDNAQRSKKDCIIVFLGDLIDRGPNSRMVFDYLINKGPDFARVEYLMGNHEEMYLRILRGADELLPRWLKYGGSECIESYGLKPEDYTGHATSVILDIFASEVPQAHIDFVKGFKESFTFGDYFLVHAGVNPQKPIEKQKPEDMRWIREPFLNWKKPLSHRVVHGHTIENNIALHPHRIGVDTGVYESGILSAVRLEDKELGLINSEGLNTDST